jgi:hypothetical protein
MAMLSGVSTVEKVFMSRLDLSLAQLDELQEVEETGRVWEPTHTWLVPAVV